MKLGRHQRLAFVALVVAVLAMTPGIAQALNVYSFTGTITDASGRALQGVTVSDGDHAATTDSAGHYSLGESSTGTFSLQATRSGLNSVTKQATVTVPLNTTVNFTMLYATTGAFSPAAITTLPAAASSVLYVTTFAPNPGAPGTSGASCVFVQDDETTVTTVATFDHSNGNGSSVWKWTKSEPAASPNGVRNVTFWTEDCGSHVALTSVLPTSLLVDNVAPQNAGRIWPLDHGHSVFPTAPITAQINDIGGSGINASSLAVRVDDESGTAVANFSASDITYTASTGALKTPAATLQVGHTYRITISGADVAGNTFSFQQDPIASGGGFTVVSSSVAPASASIPATSCTLTSNGNLSTTKTATCSNVPVVVTSSTATFSSTRYAGKATAEHVVPLSSAHFQTTIAGVTTTSAGDSSWAPAKDDVTFDVTGPSSSSVTASVPGQTVTLATLTGHVPATWSSAQIVMAPETTSTSSTGRACADPTVQLDTCIPDMVLKPYTQYTVMQMDSALSMSYDTASKQLTVTPPTMSATTYDLNGNVLASSAIDPVVGDSIGGTAAAVGSPASTGYCYFNGSGGSPDLIDTYKYLDASYSDIHGEYQFHLTGWSYFRYDSTRGWMNAWSNCASGGTDPSAGYRQDYTDVGIGMAKSESDITDTSWASGDSMSTTPSQVDFGISRGPVSVGGTLSQNSNGHNRGGRSTADWPGPDNRVLSAYWWNTSVAFWQEECGWAGCGWTFNGSSGFQGTTMENVWQLPTWDGNASYQAAAIVSDHHT